MLETVKEFRRAEPHYNLSELRGIIKSQATELDNLGVDTKSWNQKVHEAIREAKQNWKTPIKNGLWKHIATIYSHIWHNYNHKLTRNQIVRAVNKYNMAHNNSIMSLYLPKNSETGILRIHALHGSLQRVTHMSDIVRKYGPITYSSNNPVNLKPRHIDMVRDMQVKNIKLRVNLKYSNITGNKTELKLINKIKRDMFHSHVDNLDHWTLSDYIHHAYAEFAKQTGHGYTMNIRTYPTKTTFGVYVNRRRINMALPLMREFWNYLAKTAIIHMDHIYCIPECAA